MWCCGRCHNSELAAVTCLLRRWDSFRIIPVFCDQPAFQSVNIKNSEFVFANLDLTVCHDEISGTDDPESSAVDNRPASNRKLLPKLPERSNSIANLEIVLDQRVRYEMGEAIELTALQDDTREFRD